MADYLDTCLGRIEEERMRELIGDLDLACRVPAVDYEKMSLWLYLVQCVYPQGAMRERREIDPAYLPHESVLEESLEAVEGTEVFSMCDALLRRKGLSAETALGERVVDVMNAMLPHYAPPKVDEVDEVTRQRRLNRG